MMNDALLRQMFDSTSIGITVADVQGRWVRSNAAFLRMLGTTAEALVGRAFLELTHPDDRETNGRLFRQLAEGKRDGYVIEKRFLRSDGTAVWTRVTASMTVDRTMSVGLVEDITALRSEREQREALHYQLGERIKELTCLHAAARVLSDTSLSVEALLEKLVVLLPPAFQFPAHTAASVRVGSLTRTTPAFRDSAQELASSFTTSWGDFCELVVSYHQAPVKTGEPAFLVEEQTLLDSLAEMLRGELERRHVTNAFRESNARLELALSAAEMGLWEWDLETGRSYGTESVTRMVGLSGPIEGGPGVFAEFIHPDDRPRLYAHMKELAAQPHLPAQDLEYRLKRPEGGWRHVHARGIVTRDAQGRAVRILGLLTDVSVARALAESIRTSEKMDALGLVTGSVAHDFNNVLAAMSSGAQLLMHDAPPGPARDAARRIYDAALKGAAVTRQLLSFTRKSEFRLTPIDLAALLARNKPILERVVGPEIVVVTEATGDCSVVADTGRIDQLLLILALNAQEAMGGRGTLRISARPVELSSLELAATLEGRPGRMVEIAVEDSGHGMTPAVIERAFEPYFTTRQARGASGLGLAIVLSTVRQHEGHIKIESTLGRGTTVRVYLPRDTGG